MKGLCASCILAALPRAARAAAAPIFEESGGLVAVEIETVPPEGEWKRETELKGFAGSSYYTWRGGNLFRSPGNATLAYRILITRPGKYHFRIHNRHDFHDSTEENDCWVRMDDGRWTKTYSSVRGQWTWHTQHEHSHSRKLPASHDLDVGLHTLGISGRSRGFSIDRFHLYRDGVKGGEDKAQPQSVSWTPERPEFKELKRVAFYWEHGRLGLALSRAEGRLESKNAAEAAEARLAVDALKSFAEARREKVTCVKREAPDVAVELLAELGRLLGPSKTGKALLAEARKWAAEPATVRELRARQVYVPLADAAGKLQGKGEGTAADPQFARRHRKELRLITEGAMVLKAKYPGTRYCRKALALAEGLGIALPE